jgi:hypothetical protein
MSPAVGSASGWSVHEFPLGVWLWSAYGPNGGSQGRASSKDDAITRAKAEAENLNRPRMTED